MPVLPRVGEQFGRYRIESQIGRGGMGVVFGATDTRFDRVVALKVVSAALGDAEEFRLRFEREASVLARIDSPHIIEIFDYGVQADCPYLATQYVAGGDLGALLRARGAMPPRLALDVGAQIADALHDAHRVGVVHRDVKPGNVLLRNADAVEPHAYLCDFGIARTLTEGLTTPGAVTGTWSYLAPECGRGEPGTAASDIYALGCLLWVMLTGAPPYRGSDIEIAVAHQRAALPRLQGDDEAIRRLNDVLARSMAKQPGERYADADEQRSAMLDAAGIAPTVIMPVPITGPGSGAPRPLSGATVERGAQAGPDSGSLPRRGTGGVGAGGIGAGGIGAGSPHGAFPPGSSPTPPTPGSRSRGRRGLLVGAAALAVVVVAAGVLGLTRLGGAGSSPDPSASSAGAPQRLVTGDLNHDGLGDLYVEYHHSVPNTAGTLTKRYEVAKWFSDGTKLTLGPVESLQERPTGNTHPYATLVGDFDGDHENDVLDVVVVRYPAHNLRITGTLSGGAKVSQFIVEPGGKTVLPTVGDFNGDGKDDLEALLYVDDAQTSTPMVVGLSDGTGFGQLKQVGKVTGEEGAETVAYGDYNGDAKSDAAVLISVGYDKHFDEVDELDVYLSDGTAMTRSATRRFTIPSGVGGLTAADLDGDGTDEVVSVAKDDAHTVRAISLSGTTLSAPRTIGSFSRLTGQFLPFAVATSDVDGDGRDDIVAIGEINKTRAVLKVGVSDGTSLATSKWASWQRAFQTAAEHTHLPGIRTADYLSTLANPT